MGITRDRRHKHRLTGGKVNVHIKKRKAELGRPAAMTKMGHKRVRVVRARGGNMKYRALRLDVGNYTWGSENCAKKVRILGVVYNSTNNELVRTNTLVKNMIIQVDAAPFKQWYLKHYGVELGKKKGKEEGEKTKQSGHVKAKLAGRAERKNLDPNLEEQFSAGRLWAAISSRPGQCGRADGYILEGDELVFYKKKLEKKHKKA